MQAAAKRAGAFLPSASHRLLKEVDETVRLSVLSVLHFYVLRQLVPVEMQPTAPTQQLVLFSLSLSLLGNQCTL